MQRMLGFLAGAVSGALVGATLAILFAPAPGKTVREDLQHRVQQVQEQMKKAASDYIDHMKLVIESDGNYI